MSALLSTLKDLAVKSDTVCINFKSGRQVVGIINEVYDGKATIIHRSTKTQNAGNVTTTPVENIESVDLLK